MKIIDQFSNLGQGFQHSANTLIKRGTAMSGIIPTLFLVPIFVVSAWIFREVTPLLWLFSIGAFLIIILYFLFFCWFAVKSPDRLQSEEFRCEMKRIDMIAGSGLAEPVAADELLLEAPTSNPILEDSEINKDEVEK